MATAPVLLSWMARNNDPYERERSGQYRRDVEGRKVPGPTLTLLFDEASPYVDRVRDVVLFYRVPGQAPVEVRERERGLMREIVQEVRARSSKIAVHPVEWSGDDPTDHREIFRFLEVELPKWRDRFADRPLVLHISPGTPAMHTVWVLMAETGFLAPPFEVIQSIPPAFRDGGPSAIPVNIGIETFFQAYRKARPQRAAGPEECVVWVAARFRSPLLRELYDEARRFARLNVPILLLGERGTGKTTLASWIRANSPFRRKEQDDAWPSIPCGQYTPETMRAELFGYVKGAFTGADRDHDGLLREAHNDTLFLDEVGDIALDVQRLLIRALEEGSFLPLGATKPVQSRFRLITATNVPYETLSARLGADFLDRISPVTLYLPPLRQIPEDLDWMWQSVWIEARRRAGTSPHPPLPDALHTRLVERLRGHPLPGNLRDLFRVAYRLLAFTVDASTPDLAALEYALTGLTAAPTSSDNSLPRRIARTFADGYPLDAVLEETGSISTKEVQHALQHYLARELRRLARNRGTRVNALCDVTERTLLNWLR